MADRYLVPRRLDDPELIGFWTIDEFAGILIPFAWGILSQHIFIGIGLAAGAWLALRKAKARGAGSALVHAAYWYLPGSFLGLKATPPSLSPPTGDPCEQNSRTNRRRPTCGNATALPCWQVSWA